MDIIFFTSANIRIRIPIPKLGADMNMVKAILFISDPMSDYWVLDNDICIEETIIQWNKALDFDILSC